MAINIQPDKWKHFFVGLILGAGIQWAAVRVLSWQHGWIAAMSFLIVLIISYGFELFSRYTGHGHYDIWDAIAGGIGGIAGIAGIILLG